ncbi:MAG: hypothetical protein FJ144_08525 [Deltaproteobacteria bacterium]|nr:hypothetical protein [Deltaproteobacteria bacterium]
MREPDLRGDLQVGQSEAPVRVELTIGETWRYCAEFGGFVVHDGSDGKSFLAKLSPTPAGCP